MCHPICLDTQRNIELLSIPIIALNEFGPMMANLLHDQRDQAINHASFDLLGHLEKKCKHLLNHPLQMCLYP